MMFLVFTIAVLLPTCAVEGAIEEHDGIIKSFQKDVQLHKALQEQMNREKPKDWEDRFAEKFKRFCIQAIARRGYDLRYVVKSSWKNIEKKTTCYVSSGSYTFYEMWFDLENPENINEIEFFWRTKSLIGWSMIPAPGKVFPKVSVFLTAPPVKPEQGTVVEPRGYCEEEEEQEDVEEVLEDQEYDNDDEEEEEYYYTDQKEEEYYENEDKIV